MIRKIRFVAILGTTVAMMSTLVLAQSTASQPKPGGDVSGQTATASPDQVAPSKIPVDQQATKEQLAKLFEVMRVREQMKSVMNMLQQQVQQQVQTQVQEMTAKTPGASRMTPEQQVAFEKVMKRYTEKALNIYPVDEMIADISEVYQRHVSAADVDAFIAFFNSPAGQHFMDEQPAIMKEYMPRVMERVSERSKDLNIELTKELSAVVKSAPPAKAPASK